MAIRIRYLISLWVFVPVVGFSQVKLPPEVTVQFTVFSRQRLAGLCYLPTKQAQPVGLKFFTQNKSERFCYTGPAEVPFFDAADWACFAPVKVAAANSTAPLPRPVAVAVLPAGMKEALLLFIPLSKTQPSGIKFLVLSVDDDPARFPAGHIGVINATGSSYMGQVGRKVLDIPPGRGGNFAAAGPVDFRLARRVEGQWVAAGHHFFNVGPRTRVCLVLFPATTASGVAPVIRTLVDEPQATSAELAAAPLATLK
jgi:hypothetical protein